MCVWVEAAQGREGVGVTAGALQLGGVSSNSSWSFPADALEAAEQRTEGHQVFTHYKASWAAAKPGGAMVVSVS